MSGRAYRWRSGVSGTETFQPGSNVLLIRAIAGAGGATISRPAGSGAGTTTDTIPAGDSFYLKVDDDTYTLGGPGQAAALLAIVLTGTSSYTIGYRAPSGGE